MATYNLRERIPSKLSTGDVLNYPYRLNDSVYGGSVQLDLPKGAYKLECWGSSAKDIYLISGKYGTGGYASGVLTLDEKTSVWLTAGGAPTSRYYSAELGSGNASDVRVLSNSDYSRVITAGGGGAGGVLVMTAARPGESRPAAQVMRIAGVGGPGGGTSGEQGRCPESEHHAGTGGTQTTAGVNGWVSAGSVPAGTPGGFGYAGYLEWESIQYYRGGGGWYGGGCGGYLYSAEMRDGMVMTSNMYGPSGGGSGFVFCAETAASVPSRYALTSKYYLTETQNRSGWEVGMVVTEPNATSGIPEPDGTYAQGHRGEGYVRVTVLDIFNGIFIGSSAGKALAVKGIYIGDSSGKARKVIKGYIGDSSGKARRFL